MWAKIIPVHNGRFRSLEDNSGVDSPDLIFLFESTSASFSPSASMQLRALFPDVPLAGCSTGTIVEGNHLSDQGATALAVGFEASTVRIASHIFGPQPDSRSIGLSLGEQLAAEDLSVIFVLCDGLQVNGSELVAGLVKSVGPNVAISGGLAGDGARFATTFVHANGFSQPNLCAAVGIYGSSIRVARSLASGWDVFGPYRVITRSCNNVLYELDGKPALDLYERYLGDEARDLPASALLYPLQIWAPDDRENKIVRTVLAVDIEARSMTFAGDIPQGWQARLMRGNLHHLVESATDAARHAVNSFHERDPDLQPALCLSVSCVGRRLLLGQRTVEEVQGVSDVLGMDVPHIGFYSYGEIAPQNNAFNSGLHNQTLTLTLLAEVTGSPCTSA